MSNYSIINDVGILRQVSSPVSSYEEACDLINKLSDTLKNKKNGIGLSAIQIGIPKAASIIRRYDGVIYSIINPLIIETDEEIIFNGEGCLSFPGIYVSTKRYRHFVIKNFIPEDGKLREETQYYYYHGEANNPRDIESIAAQHEIDHQVGILFTDREVKQKSVPFVNLGKIGRNDPCPCNSGKKYKKCCGLVTR